MVKVVKLDDVIAMNPDRTGHTLLDENQGCVNGCRAGVSIYRRTEYDVANAHDDQEGFFVLEGKGYALIDNEEITMEPGMSFMIPAGTPHAMKCDSEYRYCKVFWFHGAC